MNAKFYSVLVVFALTGSSEFAAIALSLKFYERPGSTSFRDSSGNGNTCTCTGASCPTVDDAGKYSRCLSFDGGDILDCGSDASIKGIIVIN